MFISGYTINRHSDFIIKRMRLEKGPGYYIPDKGFHKLVASPNYFGELMEWTGWALLTLSWSGTAFAIFTAANLIPRAIKNKEWYRINFPDQYPVKRKAIIPYIL